MATGRLTWQNVSAPDFTTAMQARALGAEQISSAFSKVAGTIGDFDKRNLSQENNAAVAEAMKIQDVAALDQLMATKGIAGLGIDPSRASPELLNFMAGYREDLTSNRESDRAFTENTHNFDRQLLGEQRADKDYAAAEAEVTRNNAAMSAVHGMVPQVASREELISLTENRGREMNVDPLTMDAMLKAAAAVPEERWSVAPTIAGTAALRPEYRNTNDLLTGQENAFNMKYGSNNLARAYVDANQAYEGYTSPSLGLIERLRGKMDPGQSEEQTTVFNESAGTIQATFNNLTKEYSMLPPEVVAMVMENNLQSDDGWFAFGDADKLTFATDEARKVLDEFKTPVQLGALERGRSDIEYQTAIFAKGRSDYDRITRQREVAEDNGDTQGMARADAELAILAKQFSDMGNAAPAVPPTREGVTPVGTPPVGPDGQIGAAVQNPASMTHDGSVGPVRLPRELSQTAPPAAPGSAADLASGFGLGAMIPQQAPAGAGVAQSMSNWMGAAPPREPAPVQAPVDQAPAAPGPRRSEAPPGEQAPVVVGEQVEDAIIESAAQDPVATAQAVTIEAGIDTSPNTPVGRALTALQAGVDPETQRPLTKEQKSSHYAELEKALKAASTKYKGASKSDIMSKLLSNPKAWLK